MKSEDGRGGKSDHFEGSSRNINRQCNESPSSCQLLGDTGDSNSEQGFHMTPHRAAPLTSDLQRSFVMSQPPDGRMRNILLGCL